MKNPHPRRICLIPRVSGTGGMVSFQHKLAAGLAARGVEVCYDLQDRPYQSILVIGGTRQLAGLWRARRSGVRIVQRLDGMNWLHRLGARQGKERSSLRHYLRAEYGNAVLSLIRKYLAEHIIYQSRFTQGWWERVYGKTRPPWTVIHNGVDLDLYTPQGAEQPPSDRQRILLVEGSLMGGYEQGLEVGAKLVERLSRPGGLPVELLVVGRVSQELQKRWEAHLAPLGKAVLIVWAGLLERQQIPAIDRSAHLLYSSDIHPACPNSVIEALACGLPVLAFDTGALPELVRGDAGCVVPYGGDAWQLEPPDIDGLARAAHSILENQENFRRAARQHAEENFGLDKMVAAYLDVLIAS